MIKSSELITQLYQFNTASEQQAIQFLLSCCNSLRWAKNVAAKRPYSDLTVLLNSSDWHWQQCSESDILEAFSGHPKIGDLSALKNKYANTATAEQGQVSSANEETLIALQHYNSEYEKKFGFIFIVCASGKSAEEMLGLLKTRISNTYEREISIGAQEQNKITHLRLKNFLHETDQTS
ncbi:Uric acid degradation bifunctional protein [Thalassocella blandensis]|nr:Uric acid degradation bifunctional protein [Thalassocella blandensis]